MLRRLKTIIGRRQKVRRLAAALLALALIAFTGCSVGPDYVRPPTYTPDAYKENAGWKVAQPRDELPRGKWWEIYQDPKLNELEEQIDINNQNIATAEANFQQALAQIRIVRSAYFPTVTGGISWSRFRNSQSLGGGTRSASVGNAPGVSGGSAGGGGFGALGGNTISNYLLTGNASWELDIWGKVRRSVESAKASAQATAANLEVVRLSAQATLAQSYFLLRALDEQKRIYDRTVADYQKILDFTKNRYATGVASRGDVLQAETQLKTTQAAAIDLGVQRAQLEHAIANLIGRAASVFSVPPEPIALKVPAIPAGVPSELLERRPDVAAAERNMAAANAQIGVALAAYYPTLTLTASGGFQASDPSQWFLWPSRFWSLGAAGAQTLFDGGLRGGQTASARAAYDASVATYRQTVLTGFQEVEDNLAAMRILEQEAGVQAEAVKASRQSVDFSTNQYQAGTISHIDLMVVETAALNNERTAAIILGNRMSASALLVKALGGGWKASDLPMVDRRPPAAGPGQPAMARPESSKPAAAVKLAEESGGGTIR